MRMSHDSCTTTHTVNICGPPAYFDRKHWPVRLLGMLMLFMAAPLIGLLVAIVRLTSRGPGLYCQTRAGKDGRTFKMYKIRTMYHDAESVSGPVWCKPGDSRITPVGKILRLLHLDELPQLINVARGEMDLIGPRPERPVFVARLTQEIPSYPNRLQVLPGVTGLAQINLPPDETVDCVRKKVMLDCAYIRDANLFLDVRILLCTLLRMFGIRHGHAARFLGLQRTVELSAQIHRESRETESRRPIAAVDEIDDKQFESSDDYPALVALSAYSNDISSGIGQDSKRRKASRRRPR